MINQFDALTQARNALEAQGCIILHSVRKPQRPVITVESITGNIAWPFIEIVVKENGVQRVVRTSRINECQIIWQ